MKDRAPDSLIHAPLGKETEYKNTYDPTLLFSIPRSDNRLKLGLEAGTLPFTGVDIWNAYELSWLNGKGKPQVAIATFSVSCLSDNIVESKSFKLYLNSLNQTMFESFKNLESTLVKDLSLAFGGQVDVKITSVDQRLEDLASASQLFECIDDLDVDIDTYVHKPSLLKVDGLEVVEFRVCSHLLKSNCPVTGQPDWASVYIHYKGKKILPDSILMYLISYRDQQDFHEHCVETIFVDIDNLCSPESLTVYARYTRRGGMDINPFRSNFEEPYGNWRIARQ